jgi:hypothetical protein
VTTLGQPLEVIKTQMASQRGDTMSQALKKVWSRGGVLGCESRRLHMVLRRSSARYTVLFLENCASAVALCERRRTSGRTG